MIAIWRRLLTVSCYYAMDIGNSINNFLYYVEKLTETPSIGVCHGCDGYHIEKLLL
jgi:hypothetical protein